MKKYFIAIVLVGVCGLAAVVLSHMSKPAAQNPQEKPAGDAQYFFRAPTMATSSVSSASATLVAAADTSRQYASFCNATTTTTSYIFLTIGATSTPPAGVVIAGGSCKTMSAQDGNLFTTSIYAQTSAGTNTLTSVIQDLAN